MDARLGRMPPRTYAPLGQTLERFRLEATTTSEQPLDDPHDPYVCRRPRHVWANSGD
jgi:hypothetical protein